jgi:hypothetical protein
MMASVQVTGRTSRGKTTRIATERALQTNDASLARR